LPEPRKTGCPIQKGEAMGRVRSIGRRIALALLLLLAAPALAQPAAEASYRDVMVSFTTSDGIPLEGKLSLPASATGPVPVLFYLHGAGPGTYDTPRATRGADGQVVRFNYYDSFAREVTARGMAFFRVSKRGVTIDPATGRELVDRAVFSTATRRVLLDDYGQALAALRARPEIDPARVVLGGVSEGTALAARLAVARPAGVVGVVLDSYNGDNQRDTVIWQTTHGPWRNIQQVFPAARDGTLTRAEYDAAVAQTPALGRAVPFDQLDTDRNGAFDGAEMLALYQPGSDRLVAQIEAHDDEVVWARLLNLTSAYLLEEWHTPPTSADLLRIAVPIAIFHGELDGTTRVEAVHETEAAFRAAGKTNLT
jgi:pimeloyl-ACP methyl ester carboxylesterase